MKALALVLWLGIASWLAAGVVVRIAWDENPEPDVTAYRVYIDGVLAGEVDATVRAWDVSTEPGTEYFVQLSALNGLGFESELSRPWHFVVNENGQTTAPPSPPGGIWAEKALEVEASEDGRNWAPVVRWIDGEATSRRFYRLRWVPIE